MARRLAGAAIAVTFLWTTTVPVRANVPFGDGPVNTGEPCVAPKHYTQTDSLIYHTGLVEQSGQGNLWLRFNCFYYVMTWILGQLPAGILANPAEIKNVEFSPKASPMWSAHMVAGNAYFDQHWLVSHGYGEEFVTKSLAAGPVGIPHGNPDVLQGFKPNDVILVPSGPFNPFIPGAPTVPQSYVHTAVVTKTDGNGHVMMTRQKVNPWTCTTDLSPASFDRLFGGGDTIFEVWRLYTPTSTQPPTTGQAPPTGVPRTCLGFLKKAEEINGPVGKRQNYCIYQMCLRNGGLGASPEYTQCQ